MAKIEAIVKVALKPLVCPNYASVEVEAGQDAQSIPIRAIDERSLQALAQKWLDDLYVKSDYQCPFYSGADCEARPSPSSHT